MYPALKSALDLLNELRQSEVPVAIVVNEHGSCIGIVELIDILEKFVGEIVTNRKREMPRVEQLGRSEWRIDARGVDFRSQCGVKYPNSDRTV